MGWVTRWTPTASSDEEPGRLMVVNFFRLQRRRCLGTWVRQVSDAQQLIRTTILPSHTHHHYVRTPRCMQLLLTSLPRRARAAGLLLRLPASQPEQATASSAAAGHVGGEEAACRGRP